MTVTGTGLDCLLSEVNEDDTLRVHHHEVPTAAHQENQMLVASLVQALNYLEEEPVLRQFSRWNSGSCKAICQIRKEIKALCRPGIRLQAVEPNDQDEARRIDDAMDEQPSTSSARPDSLCQPGFRLHVEETNNGEAIANEMNETVLNGMEDVLQNQTSSSTSRPSKRMRADSGSSDTD